MPQWRDFRFGWERENLAKYILSKFCFVSEPVSVSDDQGADFICTRFELSGDYMLPRETFAIQIKSSSDTFEVTTNAQFLEKLQIPYFVGVVYEDKLTLSIYSGEGLCEFFSHFGPNIGEISRIFIRLDGKLKYPVQDHLSTQLYKEEKGKKIIIFPKILEISDKFRYENDIKQLQNLLDCCNFTQRNISSRICYEYLFEFINPNDIEIFHGSGSNESYFPNFCKRLAEAFVNIVDLVENGKLTKDSQRFQFFLKVFNSLIMISDELPPWFRKYYELFSKKIEKNNEKEVKT